MNGSGGFEERPAYVRSGRSDLFALVTRPTGPPNGLGLTVCAGGRWHDTSGREGLWKRITRRLAVRGYHSVRFDYHGVGESTGTIGGAMRVSEPFVDDVLAAMTLVEGWPVRAHVLLGNCFGARTALAAAAHVHDLAGLALVSLPVRDTTLRTQFSSLPTSWYARRALRPHVIRGLFDARERSRYVEIARRKIVHTAWSLRGRRTRRELRAIRGASPIFVDQLAELVEREVPVLMLYGADDTAGHDFGRAAAGPAREVLERAGDLVTVRTLGEGVHGFTTLASQEDTIAALDSWLEGIEVVAGSRSPES